jgi:hypothetical protein
MNKKKNRHFNYPVYTVIGLKINDNVLIVLTGGYLRTEKIKIFLSTWIVIIFLLCR